MAGNSIGGLKTRDKNLSKNPNFYKEIGARGGKATFESHGILKGFAAFTPEQLKKASAKGGKVSKRVKS